LLAQTSVLRLQFFHAAPRTTLSLGNLERTLGTCPTVEQWGSKYPTPLQPWLHCGRCYATIPGPPFCIPQCISPCGEPAYSTVSSCGLLGFCPLAHCPSNQCNPRAEY